MARMIAVSRRCAPQRTPAPRRPRHRARRLIAARVPYQLCWRQQRGSSSRTTWSQLFERLRTAAACAAPEAACGQRFWQCVDVDRRGFQALQISGPRAFMVTPRRRFHHASARRLATSPNFVLWPACKTLASRPGGQGSFFWLYALVRTVIRGGSIISHCCTTGG